MKKIIIVALHLGFGGIEKAIASFSNLFCNEYDIEIISTYKLLDKPAFDINKKVKIKYLINDKPNKKELIDSIKKLNIKKMFLESLKSFKVLYLKRKLMIDEIKKLNSDIIISTRPLHNFWVGKYGSEKSLKIAWEHAHHNNKKNYIKFLVRSCKNMNYLVIVSKSLQKFYKQYLGTKCIYIGLSLDYFPNEESNLKNKEIISVGRLSKEKGFIDLIDVFEIVNKKHNDWKLNIVGDGLEREKIHEKIHDLGLESKIIMHGFKKREELNEIYKNSSIYTMTSYKESFGLVLIEAMSFGIPCVVFDSAKGPLEIIDKSTGFIIKNRNKEKMADKIIELIENKNLRKKLGNNSRNKSRLYDKENIKKEWQKLLIKK